ncbi:hypothetical protein ACWC2K_39430 [Streptomyces chattanoogensis]
MRSQKPTRTIVDSAQDVNNDAYASWLFKIKLEAGASTDELPDAAAYKKLVG